MKLAEARRFWGKEYDVITQVEDLEGNCRELLCREEVYILDKNKRIRYTRKRLLRK